MVEFGLVWLSLVWYRGFGFVVVESCLVWCSQFLFGLEDDLNKNAIVDAWIEDIKTRPIIGRSLRID